MNTEKNRPALRIALRPARTRALHRALRCTTVFGLALTASAAWSADSGDASGTLDTMATATAAQLRNLQTYQPWRTLISVPTVGTAYAGAGVTVGIADTGVDLNHPELRGQVVSRYNALNGGTDVTDRVGHGTHVAGLVAGTLVNGALLAGVAPDAKIAFAKVFGDTGSTTGAIVDNGINWLVNTAKVPIVSLSLGGSAPLASASIQNAVNKGTLIVAAAGNDGAANPSWPARYANQAWALGRIIAVGAVDANRNIASFSNRAGDAASWYVVAPGVSIASSYPNSQYAYMSGTSMATPIVAGQAALIKGTWQYLSADKVAQVIFRTATDLGAPGIDTVYGWGMVNVAKSMNPVGVLGITLDAKKQITVNAITTTVSKAPSTMGTTGGAALVKSQAFDELGRNFTVAPGAALAPSTPLTLESVFGPSDRLLSAAAATIAPGVRLLTLTDAPRLPQLGVAADPYNTPYPTLRASSLTMVQDGPRGASTFAVGTGGLGYQAFGVAASDQGTGMQGTELALASPLLKFAGNHNFMAYGAPLGSGWLLRAGAASSYTPSVSDQGNIGMVELLKQGQGYMVSMTYGALSQPTVLGATQPLLGLAQSSRTQALSLSAAHSVGTHLAFASSMHMARTDALHAGGADSLLEGGSATRATGFGVATVWTGLAKRDDRMSLALSSPLRAVDGTLHYGVISAVDPQTGAATAGTQDVSARPSGRERIAELRYTNPLSTNSALAFSLAGRFQPDHNADARTQNLVAMRYTAAF